MTAEPLEALISGIYDAALDPGGWPDLLARVAAGMGASMAGLLIRNPDDGTVASLGAGADAVASREYDEHYAQLDPVMPRVLVAPAGRVLLDAELVDRESYVRSAFYNEWARPSGFDRGAMVRLDVGEIRPTGILAAAIVTRPPGRPAFEPAEVAILSHLAPHLGRAALLQRQLAGARSDSGRLALDRLRLPVIVTDAAGRLAWTNRAGQALVRRGDAVALGPDGHLHARTGTTASTTALPEMIASAARGQGGSLGLVPVEPGSPSLAVLASPLAQDGAAWTRLEDMLAPAPRPRVMLLFLALESAGDGGDDAATQRRLRALFGMTRAEARMALLLARGEGLLAAAEALGVARETARTHAGRILHKSGTSRQAALARLVATLALVDDSS